MSDTVKLRTFCSRPMGNKTVAVVPGLGPAGANKLKKMGLNKAKDLYEKLKRLKFDEDAFRIWLQLNCSGDVRTATVYNALKAWHTQFEDLQEDESESSRADTPPVRPAGRGGLAPRAEPARQAGRGGSALRAEPTRAVSPRDSAQVAPAQNHMALFFASFSDVCDKISPEYHTKLKMEILGIVDKFEKMSRGNPSTVRDWSL